MTELEELVEFRAPVEERVEHVQFCHDAAQCKNVDWRIVVGLLEEYFWGAIPAGGDVVGVGRPRADFTGQPEIAYFNSFSMDEKVLGFEIARLKEHGTDENIQRDAYRQVPLRFA